MKEPVVVDSTCLIGLEAIGRLDLLPSLFDPVIPPEVRIEFGSSHPWLRIEAPQDSSLIKTLDILLDAGEAEAIALAYEKQWRVVLDDLRARGVARRLDLKVIGTLGLLIRAKREGLVPSLKPLLEELDSVGFYLGEELKVEALRGVSEE